MFELNPEGINYYDRELCFDLFVIREGVRKYGSMEKAIEVIPTLEGAIFYAKELCNRVKEREYKRFGIKLETATEFEISEEITGLERGLLLQAHIYEIFKKSAPEQKENFGGGKKSELSDFLVAGMQIGLSLTECLSLTLKELTDMIESYGAIMGVKKKEEDDLKDFYDTSIRGVGGGDIVH